jgi:hypothetical protein
MLEIQDASVIKLSGKTHHPIAVSSQSDTVSGQVFEITAVEQFIFITNQLASKSFKLHGSAL